MYIFLVEVYFIVDDVDGIDAECSGADDSLLQTRDFYKAHCSNGVVARGASVEDGLVVVRHGYDFNILYCISIINNLNRVNNRNSHFGMNLGI